MHVGFEFWSGSKMGDDSRGMIPSSRRGRRARYCSNWTALKGSHETTAVATGATQPAPEARQKVAYKGQALGAPPLG